MKLSNKRQINKKSISIGQTLETNDLYLPHKKSRIPDSKSRPIIVVDKNKNEEFMVVPGSTQKTKNTREYNKYGIKNFRMVVEIDDNEGKPIKLNDKFRITNKSTKLPRSEAKYIKDYVVNHGKFSSENRKKVEIFKNRNKKK